MLRACWAAGQGVHIFAILIGAISFIAIWHWRMKVTTSAANEALDAAGRIRGAYRRRVFRRKAEASNITAIDDPALGAAVFLVCLAEVDVALTESKRQAIAAWLKDVAGADRPDEMIAYGEWVSRTAADINQVGSMLAPLWRKTLGAEERDQLLTMAGELASDIRNDHRVDILRRLRNAIATP